MTLLSKICKNRTKPTEPARSEPNQLTRTGQNYKSEHNQQLSKPNKVHPNQSAQLNNLQQNKQIEPKPTTKPDRFLTQNKTNQNNPNKPIILQAQIKAFRNHISN